MARIRTIKPEWTDDESLAKISIQANFVMVMALLFSDDFGVVKGNTIWLKNKLFPMRTDVRQSDFDSWISELQTIRMIVPYEVDGNRYFFIPGFARHQRVDKPNISNRNPPPPPDVLDTPAPSHKAPANPEPEPAKHFDAEVVALTERLVEGMLRNDARAKVPTNLNAWHEQMDKIIRIDGRTPELVAQIIDFAQSDTFWRSNILSAAKLRDKFSQLLLKHNGSNNKIPAGSGPGQKRNVPTIGAIAQELNWRGDNNQSSEQTSSAVIAGG